MAYLGHSSSYNSGYDSDSDYGYSSTDDYYVQLASKTSATGNLTTVSTSKDSSAKEINPRGYYPSSENHVSEFSNNRGAPTPPTATGTSYGMTSSESSYSRATPPASGSSHSRSGYGQTANNYGYGQTKPYAPNYDSYEYKSPSPPTKTFHSYETPITDYGYGMSPPGPAYTPKPIYSSQPTYSSKPAPRDKAPLPSYGEKQPSKPPPSSYSYDQHQSPEPIYSSRPAFSSQPPYVSEPVVPTVLKYGKNTPQESTYPSRPAYSTMKQSVSETYGYQRPLEPSKPVGSYDYKRSASGQRSTVVSQGSSQEYKPYSPPATSSVPSLSSYNVSASSRYQNLDSSAPSQAIYEYQSNLPPVSSAYEYKKMPPYTPGSASATPLASSHAAPGYDVYGSDGSFSTAELPSTNYQSYSGYDRPVQTSSDSKAISRKPIDSDLRKASPAPNTAAISRKPTKSPASEQNIRGYNSRFSPEQEIDSNPNPVNKTTKSMGDSLDAIPKYSRTSGFVCSLCQFEAVSRNSLFEHLRRRKHMGEEPGYNLNASSTKSEKFDIPKYSRTSGFVCSICQFEAVSRNTLFKHLRKTKHIGEDPDYDSDASSTKSEKAAREVKEEAESKVLVCKKCYDTGKGQYKDTQTLFDHINTFHKHVPSVDKLEADLLLHAVTRYTCKGCRRKFRERKDLLNHMGVTFHGEEGFLLEDADRLEQEYAPAKGVIPEGEHSDFESEDEMPWPENEKELTDEEYLASKKDSDVEWPDGENPLCDTCKEFRLRKSNFSLGEANDKLGYFPLEYMDIIRESTTCPFCRLLSQAFDPALLAKHFGEGENVEKDLMLGASYVNDFWDEGKLKGDNLMPEEVTRIELDITHRELDKSALTAHLTQFKAKSNSNKQIRMTGQELRSDTANISLLKFWYQVCERNHGPECIGPYVHNMEGLGSYWDVRERLRETNMYGFPDIDFRLIDVANSCVVRVGKNISAFPYCTLSYVWGTGAVLMSTKHNIEELERKQSLAEGSKFRVPKTIRDAMTITSRLGHKYLWVDALCILQDDEEGKHKTINQMDMIYGYSLLTIINASGEEANSGIVGYGGIKREVKQAVEEVKPGLRLMVIRPLQDYLDRTVYQSRSWTYQERLLSPRCLVILEGRSYFHCRKAFFSEDIVPDPAGLLNSSMEMERIPAHFMGSVSPFRAYAEIVREFSSRKLSHQSDGLNAFAGVQKLLSHDLFSSFFWGLPAAQFDVALKWQPRQKLKRRAGFPSWSWAGWEGTVDWSLREIDAKFMSKSLLQYSFIHWYKWDSDTGKPRLVWNESDHNKACKYFPKSAYYKGYLKTGSEEPFGRVDKSQEELVPDRETAPSQAAQGDMTSSVYHLLFWAPVVRFRLGRYIVNANQKNFERQLRFSPPGVTRYSLVGSDHEVCGSVQIDDSQPYSRGAFVDAVILSKVRQVDEEDETNGIYEEGMYSDEFVYTEDLKKTWSIVSIMILRWDAAGAVAERVAVGKVFASAVNMSFDGVPQWKEIVLG